MIGAAGFAGSTAGSAFFAAGGSLMFLVAFVGCAPAEQDHRSGQCDHNLFHSHTKLCDWHALRNRGEL